MFLKVFGHLNSIPMCSTFHWSPLGYINPIALRKAKIVCNFGLSECNRVKLSFCAYTVAEGPYMNCADSSI